MSLVQDSFRAAMRDEHKRKLLPPSSGSPFGAFPADYVMPNDRRRAVAEAKAKQARDAHQREMSAKPHEFLKSRSGGSGIRPGSGTPPRSPRDDDSGAVAAAASPRRQPPAAFRRRKIPPTEFRRFYERGDLPVVIQHRGNGRKLDWRVDIEKLDFHHYLPIFFDGLREVEEPFRFLAFQGCFDMLEKGGAKILPTVPQLIIPMKVALNSRDSEIMCSVLRVMQKLVVSGELIGEALVPYYRQLLPVLNLFQSRNKNLGDGIEFSQRKKSNLGDLIHETLGLLEKHGGEDAFINIKYMVPTYESCVLN